MFYDHEEVAARNGLGRLVRQHPDWLAGDFAVLGEPTDGGVEGGCQGTLRVGCHAVGVARTPPAWMGRNAIHRAAGARSVGDLRGRRAEIDGWSTARA